MIIIGCDDNNIYVEVGVRFHWVVSLMWFLSLCEVDYENSLKEYQKT